MATRETAPKATPGQTCELIASVVQALSTVIAVLNGKQVQWLIGHKKQLLNAIKTAITNLVGAIAVEVEDWQKFYSEVFGLEKDLSKVPLPNEREGFGWTVFNIGLTKEQLFDLIRQRFGGKVWKYYNDLDKAVGDRDQRTARNGYYAIRVRDRVEADDQWKNTSYNDLMAKGIKFMTIEEYMLLALWYDWKFPGQRLDVKYVTLTSSLVSDGDVLRGYLHDAGEFRVFRFDLDHSRGNLRAREVVS